MPFTFSCGSTNLNLKVSQRHPIDRIIYHFVAFGQLILFIGLQVWIFLLVHFIDEGLKGIVEGDLFREISLKIFLYPPMVMALIYIWSIAANGGLGEIR